MEEEARRGQSSKTKENEGGKVYVRLEDRRGGPTGAYGVCSSI